MAGWWFPPRRIALLEKKAGRFAAILADVLAIGTLLDERSSVAGY